MKTMKFTETIKLVVSCIIGVLLFGTAQAQADNYAFFKYKRTGPGVLFTDLSQGEEMSRTWDFGDGSTSTAKNPKHTYAAYGAYHVKLTVNFTTAAGGGSAIHEKLIGVYFNGNRNSDHVAFKENSMNNVIDILANDGLDAAYYSVAVSGPGNGTATVNVDDNVEYTPNPGFVGWDEVMVSVGDSSGASVGTRSVYINIYSEDCKYSMGLTPNWGRCPLACDINGVVQSAGQASPSADSCWGYTFHFVNAGDDIINSMEATIDIDANMTFMDGSLFRELSTSGPNTSATVNFLKTGDHTVRFALESGQQIGPHEEVHFSFNVKVNKNSSGGVYYTHLTGSANCATGGQGRAVKF